MPSSKYLDPKFSIEERVNDLIKIMTQEEKIGQMTQAEKNSINPQDVGKYFIGSVLSGGGGYPTPNTPKDWSQMVYNYQKAALQTRLAIPILYGVDAIHGHSNTKGAVIFPHNVGLGATRNPELVFKIARATAEEMIATGVYWNFAPNVSIPQDIRWGRTYEGFSENTEIVTSLGTAYLLGLQGTNLDEPNSVLATPKHYLGDGGTSWKSSKIGKRLLDQGDTILDEATLRRIHLLPYSVAIREGALCIMVSYSSWNSLKMTSNPYLLTDVLKGELGFKGFIVTDWQAVDQLSTDYYKAVVLAINAGIDMNMVPYDYKKFISTFNQAVERGEVAEARVNDAVSRILYVKFSLGLFERPCTLPESHSMVGTESHRLLARQAVSESLVLLKNDSQTLPLQKNIKTIFVSGKAANNLGMQCGGWTIEWMGIDGNNIPGTTILQGIRNKVSTGTQILYKPSGRFVPTKGIKSLPDKADIGIVVIGEAPYAESLGDKDDLNLTKKDIRLVEQMRIRCHRLVIILISGRPMIITDILPFTDAFVCAWLPGQEGEGIADVLFGEKEFVGRLPYTWPRSLDQLPLNINNLPKGEQAPLFSIDYGL